MIEIKEKASCCGCNACGDACPNGAIFFVTDEEGFLYPKVDLAKCVECGLCERVCPQLHVDDVKKNEYAEPKCFAAVHRNLSVRFDSTSGGAFSACADVIYRDGGYVGGAVWTDDFHITQYVSSKKEDLPRLRSSKYAQSDAQGFYRAVKDAVLSDAPVLICGTPCQMAALRLFLGKEYDNLYIMDFICRGNNSPKVWRKYLDWQEEQAGAKIVSIKQKNKELGWRALTTKLVFANGKIVYDTREVSFFTKGYLITNAYCRPSCYACQYKGVPRIADISVADFWAKSGMLPAELDQNLGTSLVMISNAKGARLWERASANLLTKEMDFIKALDGNPMLMSSLAPAKIDRMAFFEELEQNGFAGIITRYFQDHQRQMLLRRFLRWGRGVARLLWHNRKTPVAFLWRIKDNGLMRVLMLKPNLITRPRVHLELKGDVRLGASLNFGGGRLNVSPMDSSLLVCRGGTLISTGSESTFSYGADIEVFSGGVLEIGSGCWFNKGLNLICANHIKLGNGVIGGRDVTIRDNNGGHYINSPNYKDSQPVEIGDHVWLCEGCTIMSGVKIGSGAVIGAKAVVVRDVPANTIVFGIPAEVVRDNVEWKY